MTSVPIFTGRPRPEDQPRSIRRAVLFLSICAPIWLVPNLLGVGHPIVLVAAVVMLSFLFLRHEGRSLATLGLDASWRRLGELAAGFAGGAILVVVIALAMLLVLPFPWAWNPGFSAAMAAWSLLWLLCGNAVEELVFRGYSFERLIAGLGHWQAQLVTALLFGCSISSTGGPGRWRCWARRSARRCSGWCSCAGAASPRRRACTRRRTGCGTCCFPIRRP